MNEENGFRKLYWGFLLILIDFRIQGFDVLPDIIGYILFASAFSVLAVNSIYFVKAGKLNFPMIILSILSIYERPAQGEGFNFGPLGPFGIIIAFISIILGLMVVYNLFLGIKDMAEYHDQKDIYEEADKRWKQYLYLQIAAVVTFVLIFIPPIAVIYILGLLIVSVVITIGIMGYMKKCEKKLGNTN